MAKAGRVLEDRLFFLHPWFRRVRRETTDNSEFTRQILVSVPGRAGQKRVPGVQAVKEVVNWLCMVLFGVLALPLTSSEGRRPGAAIVRAGMDREDSEALERLGFSKETRKCKDVSFAQRSRLRHECGRLLRFARLVDLLCTETLVEVLDASITEVVRSITPEEGRWPGSVVLKVAAAACADHTAQSLAVQLCPSAAELQAEFINWLRHGCDLATFFTRNYSSAAP
ncbi:DNAH6 [Symbiodinium pilosum]|uniref:DNAH6 protein n=1 Tax=Symbiodinium pilosum TaxID=2952 RepID=A0A812WMB6_SYMPI|nr:DNAH6 [Symbiodinium pilosum]